MRRFAKPGVVLVGYALALAAGVGAVYLNDLTTPPDVQSTGMYGCGQSILFAGAFGMAGLVPTALAFWYLRSAGRVWTVLSLIALGFALPGAAAACVWPIIAGRTDSVLASFFSIASFFVAPLLALAFALGACLAPRRGPRWTFVSAAAMECVAASPLVYWFFRPAA